MTFTGVFALILGIRLFDFQSTIVLSIHKIVFLPIKGWVYEVRIGY